MLQKQIHDVVVAVVEEECGALGRDIRTKYGEAIKRRMFKKKGVLS